MINPLLIFSQITHENVQGQFSPKFILQGNLLVKLCDECDFMAEFQLSAVATY